MMVFKLLAGKVFLNEIVWNKCNNPFVFLNQLFNTLVGIGIILSKFFFGEEFCMSSNLNSMIFRPYLRHLSSS